MKARRAARHYMRNRKDAGSTARRPFPIAASGDYAGAGASAAAMPAAAATVRQTASVRASAPATPRIHTACYVETRGPDHSPSGRCSHRTIFRVGLAEDGARRIVPLPGDFPTPREAIDYARSIEEGRVRLYEDGDVRMCEVCGRPLPVTARADCRTCSSACRTARLRAHSSGESRHAASFGTPRSDVTDSARPSASPESPSSAVGIDPVVASVPPRAGAGSVPTGADGSGPIPVTA